ncbi:MAG: magnesium transporter CorA family protein [Betaproteobacteria bacterium]
MSSTPTPAPPVRIFHIASGQVSESTQWPQQLPETGFVWLAIGRTVLQDQLEQVQHSLQSLCAQPLLDLHVADLLNLQLPSHYDYTSQYDLLVFRRLSTLRGGARAPAPGRKTRGPAILRRIDTSPVGLAIFDRVLLSVHPEDFSVRESYAARLLEAGTPSGGTAGAKLPTSPADLMLRLVNLMVDQYLDLRRELNRQLDHWQAELLKPNSRFSNWSAVLDARITLHRLDEVCEDQRSAVVDWIDALQTWPDDPSPTVQRERELLKVRSRDVLEHIERVVRHVQRLEHSTEAAVQMHFSAQSHRTNEIMRTLTALTAVFLPLNFVTGFFGMNFEFMPVVHASDGLWWVIGLMLCLAVLVLGVFWRKRYLASR